MLYLIRAPLRSQLEYHSSMECGDGALSGVLAVDERKCGHNSLRRLGRTYFCRVREGPDVVMLLREAPPCQLNQPHYPASASAAWMIERVRLRAVQCVCPLLR